MLSAAIFIYRALNSKGEFEKEQEREVDGYLVLYITLMRSFVLLLLIPLIIDCVYFINSIFYVMCYFSIMYYQLCAKLLVRNLFLVVNF